MKIGDLVSKKVATEPLENFAGVIVRSQQDTSDMWWFEVLANGVLHIIPEFQLTLIGKKIDWRTTYLNKENHKNNATLYKNSTHLITLYT